MYIPITKEGLNATRKAKVDDVFLVHTASVEETNEGHEIFQIDIQSCPSPWVTSTVSKRDHIRYLTLLPCRIWMVPPMMIPRTRARCWMVVSRKANRRKKMFERILKSS
jgi:hypothetical protein